jgi:hypothetical protein
LACVGLALGVPGLTAALLADAEAWGGEVGCLVSKKFMASLMLVAGLAAGSVWVTVVVDIANKAIKQKVKS